MGKRIISALMWVMMTAAVLALILGICYGELSCLYLSWQAVFVCALAAFYHRPFS